MTVGHSPHPFLNQAFTIENVRRDFIEWHLGRPRYFLWAIDVDMQPVAERIAAAQRHLAPFLLPDYCRQPHITLSICGFPTVSPALPEDISEQAVLHQVDRLQKARLKPFSLAIGGLSSFSSAPFLTVQDSGQLNNLRGVLSVPDSTFRQECYMPHVTVGLYAGCYHIPELAPHLDVFPWRKPIELEINKVCLMHYESASIGGPLQIEKTIYLG